MYDSCLVVLLYVIFPMYEVIEVPFGVSLLSVTYFNNDAISFSQVYNFFYLVVSELSFVVTVVIDNDVVYF